MDVRTTILVLIKAATETIETETETETSLVPVPILRFRFRSLENFIQNSGHSDFFWYRLKSVKQNHVVVIYLYDI